MSDTPRSDEFLKLRRTIAEHAVFARKLERELNDAASRRCDWKQDSDGNWGTNCGQCMSFEWSPPNEQGYKFCHHCGATINFITFDIDKAP